MDNDTTQPATTMLSYDFQPHPDPLQASPAQGDLSTATLTAVVSNSTSKLIDCASIAFSFPVGENAKDLSPDMTAVEAAPPDGWSISHDGGVFTATPETEADGKIGRDGLAFIFSDIEVNRQQGRTQVTVTEVTGSGNTATASFPLGKFPPDFTVGDLDADPVSVNQGDSTTLTWSGSRNATYTLKYGDTVITETKDGQPLPATGSYTADDLQDNPTVFYLIVTQTLPGEEHPNEVQRHCPVTVLIPDVNIASFTAGRLTIYYKGSSYVSAEVDLTWDVTGAHQVLLNGNLVTGQQSATVTINGAETFTLEATGQGGPVFAETKIAAPDMLPVLSPTPDNSTQLTFYADSSNSYRITFDTTVMTGGFPMTFQYAMALEPSSSGLVNLVCPGQLSQKQGVIKSADCIIKSDTGVIIVHYTPPAGA